MKSRHPLLYRREKDRLTTRARLVQRPDLLIGIIPCVVLTSLETGAFWGNSCLYRHADGEEKPSKRSKSESAQGAVSILKEKNKRSKVVYPTIQIQRNPFCGKLGKRD